MIREIQLGNLRWLNIVTPTRRELERLRQRFVFHPLDIEDCLKPLQRSKVNTWETYHFLVLLFPVYHRKTREILPSEVDFFLTRDCLITIHRNELDALVHFFEQCQKIHPAELPKVYGETIEKLLWHLLSQLFLAMYPMLDHLSLDLTRLEKEIFRNQERRMVKEILVIRRNITDFRRTMQTHKKTLEKLIDGLKESPLFTLQKTDRYFDSLIDEAKEIWDALQGYKEAVEAYHGTNESLITFRLNDIMKNIMIISVTMLPVTLIVSIFGMNTMAMPLRDHPLGFWIILVANGVLATSLLFFFRKRGWM